MLIAALDYPWTLLGFDRDNYSIKFLKNTCLKILHRSKMIEIEDFCYFTSTILQINLTKQRIIREKLLPITGRTDACQTLQTKLVQEQ
jgi:hypothetical protein